jgi:PIN domain nuclease of toxin-antitoxin system
MRLLLDTHIFLWFLLADNRLPNANAQALRNPLNEVFVSVVSVWEATVKYQIGKLPLPGSPELYLPRQRQRHQFSSLPLDEASISHLTRLPPFHNDPFDRMLVC